MNFLLPFLCSIIALTISGCVGSSEPTDAPTLARCYASEFGTEPPAGVTNLRAKQVVVGDAGGAWMRFEANSNILSQIISNRFTLSDQTAFISSSGGGNTPAWWKPQADLLTVFYVYDLQPGSNYSVAVLAHDESHRVVYFHHGISF